jgi:3-phosphoglycerate kinase
LSDARRLAEETELAQALSTLETLIKAEKVVVLWSWVHALEMAPKDKEAIEPAIKRFNAMYRLTFRASPT